MTMDEHDAIDFDVEYNRKRSLDRRRESSRFAARDRRGKEADIFTDLKEVVPVVEEATVTHVDRIALLRLASSLCRLRKIATKLLATNSGDERTRVWSETTLLECLDGFLAMVDLEGTILYVTESVSMYLGLTQTDLTGRSLKEFVYASDYEEFTTCDAGNAAENDGWRAITLRMKSVISPRGRNLNLKSAIYKPVICYVRSLSVENGRVRVVQANAQPAGQGSSAAAAAAATKSTEIPNGTFMTRHTCDMKFSYVSESFNYILRREARSLMGTSFYSLVHPADLAAVVVSIREMLAKGHARTPYYRLIGFNKSVLWVQTEATTVNHTTKGHKGQYIICIHDLLGAQNERESFERNLLSCSNSIRIKQELEDNTDTAKSSCDDVLQWLFRAQQRNESPPRTLFRSQNRRGAEFYPLATGINRCGLRASNTRANSNRGTANGGSRDCTAHCFQAGNFSADATATTLNPSRLPTVSAIDAYVLPDSDNVNSGTSEQRNPGNMFTPVSITGTQYARSIGYEPYLSNLSAPNPIAFHNSIAQTSLQTSSVNSAAQIPRITQNKENTGSGTTENMDGWQMFAPFVAHDDMMQLSTDLQGLLPEFNLTDWVPVDPAPLPTLSASGERGITPVENIPMPMQMAFGRPDLYANAGISPLSKPSSFGLTASWRQLQQQYHQQQQHGLQQNSAVEIPRSEFPTICPRPNNPSLAFHRNASVMQQQQRV